MKAWETRLKKMSDYDKQSLIIGIEDGWIDPNDDDLHIYYKLMGIDEHPIITWFKRLFHLGKVLENIKEVVEDGKSNN